MVPIAQVLREELRQDLRLSRREESPLYPRARIHVEASDAAAQVLTQGRQGQQVKFVKSQRLVGKVHRVQTKAPKRQQANDSEDDSDSSIGSDSSTEGTHLEKRHK